jgi:hypothetical protein
LFVPPSQTSGRIANPDHYLALYASNRPEGAVAEAFGSLAVWGDAMLGGTAALGESHRALAHYRTPDAPGVLDLDDPAHLLARPLRPSRVITRNRSVTQRSALGIFLEGRWRGVRWWSYYEAEWGSFGLWDLRDFEIVEVTSLSRSHAAIRDAGEVLGRQWTRPT